MSEFFEKLIANHFAILMIAFFIFFLIMSRVSNLRYYKLIRRDLNNFNEIKKEDERIYIFNIGAIGFLFIGILAIIFS